MKFAYFPSVHLPALGWVARITPGSGSVEVFHGQYVETTPDFFVEGVWNGPFVEGGLDQSPAFFGSGGTSRSGRIVFVPSCATTDYLYWGEKEDKTLFISNSLVSLLVHLDRRLDPTFTAYHCINESIQEGIIDYDPQIPTTTGPIRRLMHNNLEVGDQGIRTYAKPLSPRFPDFSAYRGHLDRTYAALIQNTRDPVRRWPLDVLSTQSRGYDTTAVNAIAAPHGIDLALTVQASKTPGRYTTAGSGDGISDDGTEICRVLGIPVATLNRRSFMSGSEDEVLFHAGSHSCQDANLLDLKTYLKGPSILLTGTFGELWYTADWYARHPEERINDEMRRPADLGGLGLGEVRLEWNFVHVPVPFIGSRRQEDIFSITMSEEMDPWRLGNDYDRPIARRIAEEAGVPRSYFGQKKLASVVELPEPYFPVTPGLRREYEAWLVENGLASWVTVLLSPLILKFNSALVFKGFPRAGLIYYTERTISRILGRDFEFSRRLLHLVGSLYCFAVNRLADEQHDEAKGQ